MNKKIILSLIIVLVFSLIFSLLIFFDVVKIPNFLSKKNIDEFSQPVISQFESENNYPGYIKNPEQKSLVNDLADLIPYEKEKEVDDFLSSYKEKTNNIIAVLTVESFGPENIEDYTTRVFNEWNIETHKENNDLLIVVSRRKIRIGISLDFEDKLSEELLSKILEEEFLPNFRPDDISDGIIKGVNALITHI
jgi:uncharacterized membrane protein YgcG